MHQLGIERIYESINKTEHYPGAYRILVDRLWPRGVAKVKARLDEWDKDIAPSADLRTWFGHDPAKYAEFATRYRAELDANPAVADFVKRIASKLESQDVVLLFGAKDEEHNQAVVLRDYLNKALA